MYNGLTLPTAADDDLDLFLPATSSSGYVQIGLPLYDFILAMICEISNFIPWQGIESGWNFWRCIATAARRNQHNIKIYAAKAESNATGKIQLECGDCKSCHRF